MTKNKKKIDDPEKDYLTIPSPNVLEFVSGPQYLNIPSVFHYTRQYQVLRDFFQCRCPICNPLDPSAIDCWDKSREYLESENLLIWSLKYQDDVCPKCGTTREEFKEDGLLKKYNQLHGIVGMRTLNICSVLNTNYGLVSLKELAKVNSIKSPNKNEFYEIDINIQGEFGKEKASYYYYEGILPSKKIITQLGFSIEISHIHPMRVLCPTFIREWIKSEDLQVDDYLMIKVGTNLWGTNELKNNHARLAGYFVSNGGINSANLSFTLDIKYKYTMDDFILCINRASGGNSNYYKKDDSDAYEWKSSAIIYNNLLLDIGLEHGTSHTKEVPLSIRTATKEHVVEFLRSYINCDGWVNTDGGKGKKKKDGTYYDKPQVGFDTVSKKLADQVRLLLLNLGIITSMSETKSRRFRSADEKYDHNVYVVRINAGCLQKFKDTIGFIDPVKQADLDKCIKIVENTKRLSNYNNIKGGAIFLRQYLKEIDVGEGCKLDSKGNVYQNAVTIRLLGEDYDSVRACWKRKSQSLTRHIAKLVFDKTRHLGSKHCPELLQRLEDFVDERWIYLPIESIEDGECEMADLHVPGSHSFVANGFLNHNSGKTATVGMMGAYLEHRLINLSLEQVEGRLADYFGLLPKQPFEVTFIASTEVQSNDTIWAYYKSMRVDSPWFRRYVKWVKNEEKNQDTPVGMERWKYKETIREIENGYMGVKFNSKNSNSSGLAGRTRIGSFVDELCRFKQTESSMGAEEAYRVMENSLRTVRSQVNNRQLIDFLGMVASISSPISIEDKGMELLYKSTDIKAMYSFHYATWEFNPEEKREYYDEQFEKDQVGTQRDFGAKPPLAANPLVSDPDKFEERAMDLSIKPTAKLEIIPFIDKTNQRYHKCVMTDCDLLRDANRYIVFDAGKNFDSFAGACGHLEIKQLDGDILEYVTVVDWVMRVLPSKDMEVWFDACVDIIKFQKKFQKIAQVEFDRWNSVTLIQQIRNEGVTAEQSSIKASDYIKFVADCMMGRVKLLPKEEGDDQLDPPFKSPAAVGLYEVGRLERSLDDRRIYNPQKGKRRGWNSDDVAVCLIHLHKLCQDSQIMPTGAKVRSREARLKREEVGSQNFQMGRMGALFSPARLNISGKRRW